MGLDAYELFDEAIQKSQEWLNELSADLEWEQPGGVLAARERNWVALLLPLCSLSYFIAIILPTVAISRYLLGLAILCAPFCGHALHWLATRPSKLAVRSSIAVAVLALAWHGALLAHLHGMLARDSRYAMERYVRENVPAGERIEAYTQARYLPRLADAYRYEIVANLVSIRHRLRLRLVTTAPRQEPTVASLVPLWPGANFAEREVFDMFGIVFDGHPDLRRILMPDGWDGHPLRKEYPVEFRENRWVRENLNVIEIPLDADFTGKFEV